MAVKAVLQYPFTFPFHWIQMVSSRGYLAFSVFSIAHYYEKLISKSRMATTKILTKWQSDMGLRDENCHIKPSVSDAFLKEIKTHPFSIIYNLYIETKDQHMLTSYDNDHLSVPLTMHFCPLITCIIIVQLQVPHY